MSQDSRPRRRDVFRGLLHRQKSPAIQAPPSQPITAPPASRSCAASPAQTPCPTNAGQRVLRDAVLALSPELQAAIQPYADLNDLADADKALDETHAAAMKLQKVSEDKAWRFTFRGKTFLVRDLADKVLIWVNKLKLVGDSVADIDPIHIGIPWKAFCLISELAVSHHREMAAFLKGMDLALYVANKLQAYLLFLQRLPAAPSTKLLEQTMIKLYSRILEFITTAIQMYQKNGISQAWQLLWTTSSLEALEDEANNLSSHIEAAASVCERELSDQNRKDTMQWKTDLGRSLDDIRGIQTSLNDKVDEISLQVKSTQVNVVLAKLEFAKGAMHDSVLDLDLDQAQCLEGTRTELLSKINSWTIDPNGKKIFWLCGKAGTGKSTISRTIAESLSQARSSTASQAILGASFFFKRRGGDRGNASRFFPTIAYQLAERNPQMCSVIAEAVNDNFDLCNRSLGKQFDILFQPLLDATKFPSSPLKLVLILDALDECENQRDVRTILGLLAKVTTLGPFQVRIFITSRPEVEIQLGFNHIGRVAAVYEDMILEEIQGDTIARDIRKYLLHCFDEIKSEEDELPDIWPAPESIEVLVNLACPLFIFAATLCRYVSGRDLRDSRYRLSGDPQKRLDDILQQKGPRRGLDSMHTTILDQVLPDKEDTQNYEVALFALQKLLRSIVLLADPLSLPSLSRLLRLPSSEALRTLKQLQSVFQVPTSSTDTRLVRPLHASFPEFLLRNDKNDSRFNIDIAATHTALAERCLERLAQNLKKDICNVYHPGTRRADLSVDLINDSIEADIAYASCYWVHHVVESSNDNHMMITDNGSVHTFLKHHFVYWLEAQSWLGRLSAVVDHIDDLRAITNVNDAPQLLAFLEDASRFVLKFRYIVDLAPLQLYHSALYFAPLQSIIRTTFEDELCIRQHFDLLPDPPREWNAEIQKIEGLSSNSVLVFSPNGDMIAARSFDSTVWLLNARTGEEQHKLGVSDFVSHAVFSSDGKLVAAACHDNSMWLWDAYTGQLLNKHKFEGEPRSIKSISISAAGELLALIDSKQIWNIFTDQATQLEGPRDPIEAIHLSSDGQIVVAMSRNKSVTSWNAKTGALIRSCQMAESRCHAVAFSANRKLLFATISHQTMPSSPGEEGESKCEYYCWTYKEPDCKAHSDSFLMGISASMVCAVTFSPEGNVTMLVLKEKHLQLWDHDMGKFLKDLSWHGNLVSSASFSTDGMFVVSISQDCVIRIGNPWAAEESQTIISCDGDVQTVAFDPGHQVLASARADKTVRLWDSATGAEVHILDGHQDRIHALAFSPAGDLIASVSRDCTVRLWDTQTGKETRRFEVDDPWAGVAFSADGKYLFSMSSAITMQQWLVDTGEEQYHFSRSKWSLLALSVDMKVMALWWKDCDTVQLLDCRTGELIRHLKPSGGEVICIVFSPNGKQIATGSTHDNSIQVWDVCTGGMLQRFQGHQGPVTAVAFSPDAKLIASTSHDCTVRIWDAYGNCEVKVYEKHYSLPDVMFSTNGQMVSSLGEHGTIRLWNGNTGHLLHSLKHVFPFAGMTLSPNGATLATYGNSLQTWNSETGELLWELQGHYVDYKQLAFSPDGKILATRSDDRTFQLCNVLTGEKTLTIEDVTADKHNHPISVSLFSPDGQVLVIATGNVIHLWNVHTGEKEHMLEREGEEYVSASFSPNGDMLATTSMKGGIQLWGVKLGRSILELQFSDTIWVVSFAPDGQTIAFVVGDELEIHILSTRTGLEVVCISTPSSPCHLEFNLDGKSIRTEVGIFQLDHNTASSSGSSAPRISWGLSDRWIQHGSQDLLWLPKDYRGNYTDAHGKTLVIGHNSGDVSFFRLRDDIPAYSD